MAIKGTNTLFLTGVIYWGGRGGGANEKGANLGIPVFSIIMSQLNDQKVISRI